MIIIKMAIIMVQATTACCQRSDNSSFSSYDYLTIGVSNFPTGAISHGLHGLLLKKARRQEGRRNVVDVLR